MVVAQNLTIHLLFVQCSCSVPGAEKPKSMFFFQTRRVQLLPKRCPFDLLPCLLFMGKLQLGLDMCWIELGALCALYNCNSWWYSVLYLAKILPLSSEFICDISQHACSLFAYCPAVQSNIVQQVNFFFSCYAETSHWSWSWWRLFVIRFKWFKPVLFLQVMSGELRKRRTATNECKNLAGLLVLSLK